MTVHRDGPGSLYARPCRPGGDAVAPAPAAASAPPAAAKPKTMREQIQELVDAAIIKSATCASCGAAIFWATSATSGRAVPLDVKPVTTYFVNRQTKCVEARSAFVSHFATCPQASQHRKGAST